jgi:hypothetical protein
MTKEQEEKLDKLLKEKFEEVRTNSLRTGARLVASVVIGIVKEDKPYNQRINEILRFCSNVLEKAVVDSENG